MDNPRPEKVAVVEDVRRQFDGSSAAIITEYRGLKVKDLAGLRRSLRASGGEFRIYKNTLVRLAARSSGLEALEGMLAGPTGIAFVSGDAATVAKTLRDFSRTNPLLVIKGGILGEKVIGGPEAAALAELPSREILLAQFAGAMAAPLQQLAGLMQALPRNLAYGLSALRDKLAADGPAGAPEPSEPASDAASGGPAEEGTPGGPPAGDETAGAGPAADDIAAGATSGVEPEDPSE